MSTLGVVIPTKNSMAYLPSHLQGLAGWIDLAEQVVMVDSFSQDGTVEFVRSHLKHPRLSILNHPPGLYASWNFGLERLQKDYAYIATVGDTITREGLQGLMKTADRLRADVVISKPRFVERDGRSGPDIFWPVDDMIQTLNITEPRLLHPIEVLIFAAAHAGGALLGSCASNLFRADVLKRSPFSSDFGTAGDAAWGVAHVFDVRWAVTPDVCTTFLRHPNSASPDEVKSWQSSKRMDLVLRSTLERELGIGRLGQDGLRELRFEELLEAVSVLREDKDRFDLVRRKSFPWILNPSAWLTRARRQASRRRVRWLQEDALRRFQQSPKLTQPLLQQDSAGPV